jgi:hypothetical protein
MPNPTTHDMSPELKSFLKRAHEIGFDNAYAELPVTEPKGFDYTEWRRTQPEETIDEIYAKIKQMREEKERGDVCN